MKVRVRRSSGKGFWRSGGDVHTGADEPYLFSSVRVGGLDPERRSYFSLASFSDPDGNGWMLQEVTARLPGRMEVNTALTSAVEFAATLRRAAAAHGEHEKRTGEHDVNWADWYAEYIVREQAGEPLPSCPPTRPSVICCALSMAD